MKCYFCCSAYDPFGLLFTCRVLSLLQGAQDHDLQFDEVPQLGFWCRNGCRRQLCSCEPTYSSADASREPHRDFGCEPTDCSANASREPHRNFGCEPTDCSANASREPHRNCVDNLSLVLAAPAPRTVQQPDRLLGSRDRCL